MAAAVVTTGIVGGGGGAAALASSRPVAPSLTEIARTFSWLHDGQVVTRTRTSLDPVWCPDDMLGPSPVLPAPYRGQDGVTAAYREPRHASGNRALPSVQVLRFASAEEATTAWEGVRTSARQCQGTYPGHGTYSARKLVTAPRAGRQAFAYRVDQYDDGRRHLHIETITAYVLVGDLVETSTVNRSVGRPAAVARHDLFGRRLVDDLARTTVRADR